MLKRNLRTKNARILAAELAAYCVHTASISSSYRNKSSHKNSEDEKCKKMSTLFKNLSKSIVNLEFELVISTLGLIFFFWLLVSVIKLFATAIWCMSWLQSLIFLKEIYHFYWILCPYCSDNLSFCIKVNKETDSFIFFYFQARFEKSKGLLEYQNILYLELQMPLSNSRSSIFPKVGWC